MTQLLDLRLNKIGKQHGARWGPPKISLRALAMIFHFSESEVPLLWIMIKRTWLMKLLKVFGKICGRITILETDTCVCEVTSVIFNSLRPNGPKLTRLCPWDSPGKNTGVSCHAHLQRIFLTQSQTRISYVYLHWQEGSLPLVPPGKPRGLLTGL